MTCLLAMRALQGRCIDEDGNKWAGRNSTPDATRRKTEREELLGAQKQEKRPEVAGTEKETCPPQEQLLRKQPTPPITGRRTQLFT